MVTLFRRDTMKRMYWMPDVIVEVMILVSYFCYAGDVVGGGVSAGVRLPGARAVIEASRYPSLQAALTRVMISSRKS